MSTTTQTVSPLRRLAEFGQSPWLDFIRRGFIADGSLRRLVGTMRICGVPGTGEKGSGRLAG